MYKATDMLQSKSKCISSELVVAPIVPELSSNLLYNMPVASYVWSEHACLRLARPYICGRAG
jgi:hypothetical protein